MSAASALDRGLSRWSQSSIVGLASVLVGLQGLADYVTGYELSMSLFYVVPVALAAWYGGRAATVAIAGLSCVVWYVADLAAGHLYSHPAIPVWNSMVRLGFFLLSGLLLDALRRTLGRERARARTDSLTGLLSRRGFEERLEHDLALAQRVGGPITLAYVDLDDFKSVNDRHGHPAGDRVLQTVGRVLRQLLRRADTAARIGGDEFAVILPDTGADGARELVSKLEGDLRVALTGGGPAVTCSVGIVTWLDASLPMGEAVATADALMYEVKRGGKAGVAHRVVTEAGGASGPAGSRSRD
jgi:diguanylate cyclase (GGDEF)-like protein